jgi:methylamine dehydrogenase accessory protein MauD
MGAQSNRLDNPVSARVNYPSASREEWQTVRGWWAISYVVLWILVLALSLVVVSLARQIGTLHLRLAPRGALEVDAEGPPLGEAPEPVDVRAPGGELVAVGGPGDPQLLLFVSPGCALCRDVLPALPVVARTGGMMPIVISDAAEMHPAAPAGVHGVAAPELARTYGVPGTPYAVVLDAIGIVRAKGLVNNLEQLEGLIDTARRRLESAARGEAVH